MSNIDKQLHKIAIDIQQSIEDSQDEHRLITDGGIINIISEFGLGETEFHTADIERLVCQKQLLEKEYKKLFDMFYVESTKNDLQAEKIIELQNQRDELQKEFNKAISKRNKCIESLNILNEQLDELEKQRDELITLIQDVIDYSMDYNPVWVELAQELIKKCKP